MSREFNFDELDKAVNSLIGKTGDPQQPPQSAAAPVAQTSAPQPTAAPAVTVPSRTATPVPSRGASISAIERPVPTLSATPPPEPANPAPLPEPTPPTPQPVKPPTSPKPPAEKPSIPGRFMDVVHPASDMAIPAREEVKQGMGAEGKTIAPLSANITPDPLPEKSAANTPNSAQLSMQGEVNPDALITTPDTEEKEWKDPLDEATKNEKERSIKEGAQERLGLSPKPASDDAPKPGPEEEKKPLFLPDAKVEKRPLGAFAEPDSSSDESKDSKNEAKDNPAKLTIDGIDDIDAKNKDENQDSYEPLPPELGKEIVAVEAGDIIAGEGESEKKKESKDDRKEDDKKSTKNKTINKTDAKPATFSIPKQYTEKSTPTDHKPKSIYDTEEYHRSLATAASKKKKSKWWVWVLIVIGLLVVGIGAGAGMYFVVQP